MARSARGELPYFLADTLGAWYPKHCVVAVINDAARAGEITEALYALGLKAGEVRFFLGPEVVALTAQGHDRLGPITRVIANMTALADEGLAEREYAAEAAHGRNVFVVRVDDRTQVATVSDTLRAHGGRLIRYYDDFALSTPGS